MVQTGIEGAAAKRVYKGGPQDEEEELKKVGMSGLVSGDKPEASYGYTGGTAQEKFKDEGINLYSFNNSQLIFIEGLLPLLLDTGGKWWGWGEGWWQASYHHNEQDRRIQIFSDS